MRRLKSRASDTRALQRSGNLQILGTNKDLSYPSIIQSPRSSMGYLCQGDSSAGPENKNSSKKIFFMNVGYPDFKAALQKRGWIESLDKENEFLDLKFTFCHSDINYHKLKPGTLVNYCRAEGSLTCKTSLIETLSGNQAYWASWLSKSGETDLALSGFSKGGVNSFFPKSFVISN